MHTPFNPVIPFLETDPTETPVHILKYIHIYPKNEHYSIVYNNEVWETIQMSINWRLRK